MGTKMGKKAQRLTQESKLLFRMSEYYLKYYGDLWYQILEGLSFQTRHCAVINRLADSRVTEMLRKQGSQRIDFQSLPQKPCDVMRMPLKKALEHELVFMNAAKTVQLSGTLSKWELFLTKKNSDKLSRFVQSCSDIVDWRQLPFDINILLRRSSLPPNMESDLFCLEDEPPVSEGYVKEINKLPTRLSLDCEVLKNFSSFPNPTSLRKNGSVLPYYLLDVSSLLPVLALEVRHDDYVLDMCASPGGKSFAILQLLQRTGMLVANDSSDVRYKRLQRTLADYVPADVLARHVGLTNWNGATFGKEETGKFDKVLVDAPCSAERHVVQDNFSESGWSVRKMKENSALQRKLLTSALQAVRPGGTVVYSTCAISSVENDDVVADVVKACKAEHNIISLIDHDELPTIMWLFSPDLLYRFEDVKHGIMILPTAQRNWGPMYCSRIIRLS